MQPCLKSLFIHIIHYLLLIPIMIPRSLLYLSAALLCSKAALAASSAAAPAPSGTGEPENPNIYAVDDGPTPDNSAGIGVEFETSRIIFGNKDCSQDDTNAAKGKLVNNRKGDNWQLTADTTQNIAGQLTAEYILNGINIKIGTGDAKKAAAAVASDIVSCTLENP
jgi:hypothetical protein